MDRISVIVPCFNQAHYLQESIHSLISQNYINWECIIVNDGSTDNTEEIALKLCEKDGRIRYIKKPNGGLSSARNAGLKICKGDFIQFLDADDIIKSTKFSDSISAFNKHNDCDIVISNFECVNEKVDHIVPSYCDLSNVSFSYESVLLEWDKTYTIPIHCGLFRKCLFEEFLFIENLKAKEDWIMWLHVFKRTCKISFINKPLAVYRLHRNGMTNNALHMYTNTVKAFRFIYSELEENYKYAFLKKTNEYWEEKIIELDEYKTSLIESRSYKIASGLVRIYALVYKKYIKYKHANRSYTKL